MLKYDFESQSQYGSMKVGMRAKVTVRKTKVVKYWLNFVEFVQQISRITRKNDFAK